MENKHNQLEKYIGELFAALPRRVFELDHKQAVWLKIQNRLRILREQAKSKTLAGSGWPVFHWGRLATMALAVVIAVGVVGGATKASEGSLPGDALYPVKRVAERVEKILATNEEAKVNVGIKVAQRRLKEATALVAENKPQQAVEALQEFKTAAEQVVQIAVESKPELKYRVADLISKETDILAAVQPQVEGDVKQAVEEVIAASRESITKLQSNDPGGPEDGKKVEGATTEGSDEPAVGPAPAAPKPQPRDGVIESPIQIGDVLKFEPDKPAETGDAEPKILPSPTAE